MDASRPGVILFKKSAHSEPEERDLRGEVDGLMTGSTKVTRTFDHFLEPLPESSLKGRSCLRFTTPCGHTCLMKSGLIQCMMPLLVSKMTLDNAENKDKRGRDCGNDVHGIDEAVKLQKK
ncbi:hypothetical protein PHMEG_0006908 [Phytophthora megakarya]|uniref:Uncharacterized protein n=1 Tax=Phytophthora megakarya TaxID=4795 RepID=A0A225WN42_9STRA|nr:hypothetical protein PHMEG_0006908 [Phytophthora megakarya]